MQPAVERCPSVVEESHPSESSGEDDGTLDTTSPSPRKRKRDENTTPSCELCKARKVKCDRAKPACSWCARRNRICVYLERQKPGSRATFGLELEAQASRTQSRLEELERRFDEHLAAGRCDDTTARPASPPPSHRTPSIRAYGGEHASHRGVLAYDQSSSIAQSHSATPVSNPYPSLGPGSERDAYGMRANTQSHSGYPSIIQDCSASNRLGTPHAEQTSSVLVVDDLPPQDMLYTLTDLYFKHCNTWCPILERKTVFSVFDTYPRISEEDRVLLHAIVATTLRFFRDARMGPEAKIRQYAISKRAVQMHSLEHLTVPALRALVVLCLDIFGTQNGPCGGVLMASLSESVKQLGLCDETSVFLACESSEDDTTRSGLVFKLTTAQPGSFIEDEGRRRLCWMVYILDKYATVAAAITPDFTFADHHMRRVLPCSYDLFSRDIPVETHWFGSPGDLDGETRLSMINKSENLGSFSYHCEVVRILSRAHDFATTPLDIYSPSETANWRNTYRQLDTTLDGWLQSLPGEYSRLSALCHTDPASRVANWFILHSAYVVAVVRLHSPAAYPVAQSHLLVPSDYAMQRCISAVKSLGGIVEDVRAGDGLDLLGPLFASSLWIAARVLLVHAATLGEPVDPTIDLFVATLEDMGRHWSVASRYAEVLSRVVRSGRQGNGSWAAMRRSAHDLVNLTAARRESGLGLMSTQIATQWELDNIEVFAFFNYPRHR
ncbi:C6 transcription factor [Scedosporium apiospermum]|uniref:C6 transcription factor n=1 Tax=Pseudallescheria apiosperma TaxID=563466 RepID=A0A084G8I4_PSEDA|nr:C6 transcription factor [Scedosporium apiospermum]KEZ43646.1 C6 transcription factor [Scedosporium apiospermum]